MVKDFSPNRHASWKQEPKDQSAPSNSWGTWTSFAPQHEQGAGNWSHVKAGPNKRRGRT